MFFSVKIDHFIFTDFFCIYEYRYFSNFISVIPCKWYVSESSVIYKTKPYTRANSISFTICSTFDESITKYVTDSNAFPVLTSVFGIRQIGRLYVSKREVLCMTLTFIWGLSPCVGTFFVVFLHKLTSIG